MSNLSNLLGNINNAQKQTNNLAGDIKGQSATNGCEVGDAIEQVGSPCTR